MQEKEDKVNRLEKIWKTIDEFPNMEKIRQFNI